MIRDDSIVYSLCIIQSSFTFLRNIRLILLWICTCELSTVEHVIIVA